MWIFGGCLLLPQMAFSHDLWLIPPETFITEKLVVIRANSGMEFPKSEHAPDPVNFQRRLVLSPDHTESDLAAGGTEEQSGLLRFEPVKRGRCRASRYGSEGTRPTQEPCASSIAWNGIDGCRYEGGRIAPTTRFA